MAFLGANAVDAPLSPPASEPRKTFSLVIKPENKGILGELDAKGVVTFLVEAGPGASLRGTRLFDIMMDAFGDAAKAIRAVWIKGAQGGTSTNIDKVNDLVAAGTALQEAVLQTWTVTRARRRGFANVVLLKEEKDSAGAYQKLEVLIAR